MIWSIHTRRLSMWMIVLALLMLTISLAACSSNGTNQGTPVVQTTESAQPQQGASTTVSQSVSSTSQLPTQSNTTSTGTTTGLQNTDQQIQKTLQSLDNAQNDVNTSSSVQENAPQP